MYNIFIFFLYLFSLYSRIFFFFFFNDTATTEIYTLSLHDALPISDGNYLKQFSPDYFTDRYANEWGEALNFDGRSEEHTSELQSPCNLVCRLLLEKKKQRTSTSSSPAHRFDRHPNSTPSPP